MGLARMAAGLMLGTALTALGTGTAFAQATAAPATNPNARNLTLLERLVIGAGAPKVAIDTPQAVTVVDQEDIDRKQAGTIGEVFDDIPGVTMVGSERAFGETFNIRGIVSSDSPTSSGDGSKIIINVDGAQKFYEQYRMGSFFSDPELYKQVEVLRGPASSTLYGSGALGGVINFTTKDAADFIKEGSNGAFRVKQGFDSNGLGTATSLLLAQHINETFDVLATGTFRRSEVQQMANGQPLTGSDFGAWSGLLKGTAHFGENNEQVANLSYQRWQSAVDDQLYNQTGFIPPALGGFGTIDRDVTDQTVVLSYENPDSANPMVDLKASLSFADTLVQQRNPSNPAVASIGPADYGYTNYQANVQNSSQFGAEGWENFLTYGASINHQIRTGHLLNGGLITTHPEGEQTKFGVFVQDEHTWNETFTLIGGVRADFVNLDPSPALAGAAPRSDVALSPKVAALYRVNDGFNLFGSVAHTERVPSLDELYQYATNPAGTVITRTASLQLVKERSDNFELGFSTQAYDVLGGENAVTFKATGFYNDIKDGIRSNPNYISAAATPGLPYFVNVANMRIYGLELEGAYESESLFGRLAYTLTRGEYASRVSASIPAGAPVDTLAQDKLVVTVGGRAYEGQLEFGTKFTLAFDPIYAVSAGSGANGTATAWNTVDLFAKWNPVEGPLAGLEATAAIENLFNADYRENLALDRSRGRTFKLTLAKQFDY